MTTSVIVIVAGRAQHLVRLLAGLARGQRRPDEVVIVDMGSRHDAETLARTAADQVPVVWVDLSDNGSRPRRLPLARARNAGAARATGDRLIFLDVDCIPSGDLVRSYEEAIERGGVVCAPVRYLERFWCVDLDLGGDDVDDCLWYRSAYHPARPRPEVERCDRDHELFWSLSFGLDRPTWERIGGFDEAYVGYGGEDTDFGFRARASGVPIRWVCDGVAFHQWHEGSVPPVQHLESLVANARRFRERWGTWPMEGWLGDLRERGLVEWDPTSTTLFATSSMPRSTPQLRIVSIPSTHPYTRKVLPRDVDVSADPTSPWWPHPALEPSWIVAHAGDIDVVHVHFGFEHRAPDALERWCRELRHQRVGLVVTVHDLHNPHTVDNTRHEHHLATLIGHADEVLTLTASAADEIERRWGRRPLIVAHPHLAPLDWADRFGRRTERSGPKRVGINFKSFRANTVEPHRLLAGVAAGARVVGAEVVVTAHAGASAGDLRRVQAAADRAGTPVDLVERASDTRMLQDLVDLDVLVLPYGFGSHSGLLELCHDVGTRVVAPDIGFYRDQWDDVELFHLEEPNLVDEMSVRIAVDEALRRKPPVPADMSLRDGERAAVSAQHLALYQATASGGRA